MNSRTAALRHRLRSCRLLGRRAAAEAVPEARIDLLEKLPVPFGLIRYGVAPDHRSTKGAARFLDRTLSRERCDSRQRPGRSRPHA